MHLNLWQKRQKHQSKIDKEKARISKLIHVYQDITLHLLAIFFYSIVLITIVQSELYVQVAESESLKCYPTTFLHQCFVKQKGKN